MPDRRNTKEYYESFICKKNAKSIKKIQNNYSVIKAFEKPNIADITSVILEHLH